MSSDWDFFVQQLRISAKIFMALLALFLLIAAAIIPWWKRWK